MNPSLTPPAPIEVTPGTRTITVRPVRAAFGPKVSLVSVDSDGRLWVRFSTAVIVMVAGLCLLAIPMFALWWVSGDLMNSGQVNLDPDQTHQTGTVDPGKKTPSHDPNPTELPPAG